MTEPTPFYPRTAPLCTSGEWRNWAGYLAAGVYGPAHDWEYTAIRNSAALIDVSPLYKYMVTGPDAERLLDRVMTRDIRRCAVGQVMYSPWCDDDGNLIDDGTLARLDDSHFRVTSAEPTLVWFQDCGLGMEVEIHDISADLAALAVQGPASRLLIERALPGISLEGLRYYRLKTFDWGGVPLTITRTGYTGDLGYELWIQAGSAVALWDALAAAAPEYGAMPAGIIALDIARIEAGLPMLGVDYFSSRTALNKAQKSAPHEAGMGWAVDMKKPAFVGKRALQRRLQAGLEWEWVGVEVSWESLEALYAAWDLSVRVAGRASRAAAPLYAAGRQIGQVTSHTFSPVLKKYIGLATIERRSVNAPWPLQMEFTVEYHRLNASARLTRTVFYSPAHKKD